jgi:hypothetical protein
MPFNSGEWGYWVWPEILDRLRGEARRLGLEHCVTTTRSDMALTIWFHEESDARVFQEIMTTDDGPIGRQVVCPRPWMLPEDDWLLDGYEAKLRCPTGDGPWATETMRTNRVTQVRRSANARS